MSTIEKLENGFVIIRNAQVMFRNFQGKEGKFNAAGERNFCIFLDPDEADALRSEKWNVKTLNPREPDDEPQAYITVKLKFRRVNDSQDGNEYSPKIIMVSNHGRVFIGPEQSAMLDTARFTKWDLVIAPYHWEVNGKTGVTAYLRTLYATLEEDPLEMEYENRFQDVPDSATNTMTFAAVKSDSELED